MSIFLDDDDVAQLTGYTKKSKQVEWLDRRQWAFEISRLGKVKVLKKYAEMKLGMPGNVDISITLMPYQRVMFFKIF